VNEARKLLAVAENNGRTSVYRPVRRLPPPGCSSPSITLPGSQAHMGGWAPDGRRTTSPEQSRHRRHAAVVDVSDPSMRSCSHVEVTGDGSPTTSTSTRLDAAVRRASRHFGNTGSSSVQTVVILDVSDIQVRRTDRSVRVVSTYSGMTKGRWSRCSLSPGTVASTSSAQTRAAARERWGLGAACDAAHPRLGYPQIIDITDETKPTLVSKLRLE